MSDGQRLHPRPGENAGQMPPFLHFAVDQTEAPEVKAYMRAQAILQAAFHTFGNPELKPGTMTITYGDLAEALDVARAMLMAMSDKKKDARTIRLESEASGKFVSRCANMLISQGDTNFKQAMEAAGFSSTIPS